MKIYVKPAVDVVELSVKENMAALPKAAQSKSTGTYTYNSQQVATVVYDLAEENVSTVNDEYEAV